MAIEGGFYHRAGSGSQLNLVVVRYQCLVQSVSSGNEVFSFIDVDFESSKTQSALLVLLDLIFDGMKEARRYQNVRR